MYVQYVRRERDASRITYTDTKMYLRYISENTPAQGLPLELDRGGLQLVSRMPWWYSVGKSHATRGGIQR